MSSDVIYVGVIASLTGPGAREALNIVSAISFGFWVVNNQSNILPPNTKIVPVWKDDQSQDTNSFFCGLELAGVQCRDPSFVVQKTDMVVGPIYSAESSVACQVAEMFSFPLLTMSSMPNLTQCPFFNRIVGNDTSEANELALVIKQFGWESIGIIFASDGYSSTLADVLEQSCEMLGITVDVKQAFIPADTQPQLGQLKTLGIRIYIVAAYAFDGQRIFAELKQEGMYGHPYVYMVTASMGGMASEFLPEGSLQLFLDTPKDTPEYAEYVRLWALAEATDPNIVLNVSVEESLPYGYDAVVLAARALATKTAAIKQCTVNAPANDCQSIISGQGLQEILRTITFRGVTGDVSLDSLGNRQDPFYGLNNVQSGKSVIVAWTQSGAFSLIAPIVWPDGTHHVPLDRYRVALQFLTPTTLAIVIALLVLVYLIIFASIGALIFWSNRKGAHASPRRLMRASLFLIACFFLNTAIIPEMVGNAPTSKWFIALAIFTLTSLLYIELRLLSMTFTSTPLQSLPYPRMSLLIPLGWSLVIQVAFLVWWTIDYTVFGAYDHYTQVSAIAVPTVPALWTLVCIVEIWRIRAIPGKYLRNLSITLSVYVIALLQVLIAGFALAPNSFAGQSQLMEVLCCQALVVVMVITYFIPLVNAIKPRSPKRITPGSIVGDRLLTLLELEEVYSRSLQDILRLSRTAERETELISELLQQQLKVGDEVRYIDGRRNPCGPLTSCLGMHIPSVSRGSHSRSSMTHTELDIAALILPDDLKDAIYNKSNGSTANNKLSSNPKRKGSGSPSKPRRSQFSSNVQPHLTVQPNLVPNITRPTRPRRSASASSSASMFANNNSGSSSSEASPMHRNAVHRQRLTAARARSHESLGSMRLQTKQLRDASNSRDSNEMPAPPLPIKRTGSASGKRPENIFFQTSELRKLPGVAQLSPIPSAGLSEAPETRREFPCPSVISEEESSRTRSPGAGPGAAINSHPEPSVKSKTTTRTTTTSSDPSVAQTTASNTTTGGSRSPDRLDSRVSQLAVMPTTTGSNLISRENSELLLGMPLTNSPSPRLRRIGIMSSPLLDLRRILTRAGSRDVVDSSTDSPHPIITDLKSRDPPQQ